MRTRQSVAETRLAVYGTLVPGGVNHHQLRGLRGSWRKGTVSGHLLLDGWGAIHGCPGIVLDPHGDAVPVHILTSPNLPAHWPRLDAFEGSDYRRTIARAETNAGPIWVSIYRINR